MKIVAGIVLYKPNEMRFMECLSIVLAQFDGVILFDNIGDQEKYCNYDSKITYITEHVNKGLAYALNCIMQSAKDKGIEWVVTLDQDTILPINLVEEYRKYIDVMPGIAILSPQVIDRRRPYMKVEICNSPIKEIDYCITSASCTKVEVWNEIGGFDEWLFIDFIDTDFCKRVIVEGYKILRLTEVAIDQEFGDIVLKSPKKVKLYLWLSKILRNKNVAKLCYKKNVSPMRVYHVHKNILYLNKKYINYEPICYKHFFCKSFMGFLLYYTLPSFVRGKEKIAIAKAIIKGFCDGHKSNPCVIS